MNYRKMLNQNAICTDEDVSDVLDNIEIDVNNIKDKLESIKGLAEIDEIKEAVCELADRLY